MTFYNRKEHSLPIIQLFKMLIRHRHSDLWGSFNNISTSSWIFIDKAFGQALSGTGKTYNVIDELRNLENLGVLRTHQLSRDYIRYFLDLEFVNFMLAVLSKDMGQNVMRNLGKIVYSTHAPEIVFSISMRYKYPSINTEIIYQQ